MSTAARIARFSIVRPASLEPAAGQIPGMEWMATRDAPCREGGAAHAGRVPRAQAARTRSRSARTDMRSAGTATRAHWYARSDPTARSCRDAHARGPGMALSAPCSSSASTVNGCRSAAGAADDHERRVRGRGVPNRTVGLAQATRALGFAGRRRGPADSRRIPRVAARPSLARVRSWTADQFACPRWKSA